MSTSTNSGTGITGLLLILFVGLKLTGHITWSWWWVLSPIWIHLLLGFIIIVLVIVFEDSK